MDPSPELQQQNADTRIEILLAARLGRGDPAPEWLVEMLEAHEVDPGDGILVEFDEVREEGVTFRYGTWLTRSREFWAFEIRVDDDGGEPDIQVFENITAVTSTAGYMPGVGKPFGALALEVLAELLTATRA